ncbi:MAG: tRNA lysidine(34) synthetase TilS [Pseudomonadota bacterium]
MAAAMAQDGAQETVLSVRAAFERLCPPGALGVALSGGSDSTALLLLACGWAGPERRVEAATLDHRLRTEAAEEARVCARLCARHRVEHTTLVWDEAPGQGNLAQAAREARYRLLGAWARERGLKAVLLGHTLDDQAETVLLRLARGSGVDGLCAMAEARHWQGMLWLRPLLGVRRQALRDWLGLQGQGWIDDPTNDDPKADRIKARRALEALAPLGIAPQGLAATAARLVDARQVLEGAAADLAVTARRSGPLGSVELALAPLTAAAHETRLRLLAETLRRLSSAPYPPRRAALERLWQAAAAPGFTGATLSGCTLTPIPGGLRLAREYAALPPPMPARDALLWDGRWRLGLGGAWPTAWIAATGEAGLAALRQAEAGVLDPAWTRAPAALRASAPALWGENATLLAVPAARYAHPGLDPSCTATLEDMAFAIDL